MEPQKYPERHYTPGGELIEPYDITSWSLPLHKGLTSVQIDVRYQDLEQALVPCQKDYSLSAPAGNLPFAVLQSTNNEAYSLTFEALKKGITIKRCKGSLTINGSVIPAGSFLLDNNEGTNDILKKASFPVLFLSEVPKGDWQTLSLPRIALIESYFHDMDAGWTRFVLDTYGIPFTTLRPGEIEKANISRKFDVILLPDQDASVLKEGKYKGNDQYFMTNYRPEFVKGMGNKGFDSLVSFFSKGGIIVSWGQSTNLFDGNMIFKAKGDTQEFRLPFHNVAEGQGMKGVNCPGSLVKMKIHHFNSLTYGMGDETGIFYRGRPAFTTSIPRFDMDRRVIGYFGEEDPLMSGFLEGRKLLTNKAVMIWLKKGNGQLVLMGFSPIFRASVPADYKLLFNSILLTRLKD